MDKCVYFNCLKVISGFYNSSKSFVFYTPRNSDFFLRSGRYIVFIFD